MMFATLPLTGLRGPASDAAWVRAPHGASHDPRGGGLCSDHHPPGGRVPAYRDMMTLARSLPLRK